MTKRLSLRRAFTTALATGALAVGLGGTAMVGQAVASDAASPAPVKPAPAKTAAARPNVVVILVDDLDWADVSTYGRTDVPTPNIDRIARSGVAFTDGYVAASVCAVSRAGLLTGRMPQRFGFTYNINDEGDTGAGLPVGQKTLADRLRPLGYRSGAFGKWHLGAERQFYPTQRGFDEFFGFLAGETNYIDPATPGIVTTPTKEDKYPIGPRTGNHAIVEGPDARPADDFTRYLTDQITDRTIDFIDRAAAHKNQPFFAYVAYNAPHWPLQVPQAYYDRFAAIKDPVRRTYVAMIAAMDDGVGRILDTLEQRGVRDNTIVVFLSDNGCPHRFGFCNPDHPWGAGKFTYLEGGVRVPFMMRWPRRIKPHTVHTTPISSLDVFPTVVKAAGLKSPPRPYDGTDIMVQLADQAVWSRRPLYWRSTPIRAVREGDWKYVETYDGERLLYDLKADPRETVNLASRETKRVQALQAKLDTWEADKVAPAWKPRFVEFDFAGRHFKYQP